MEPKPIRVLIFDLWETIGSKGVGISKTLMEHFGIEKTPDFLTKYENSIQLKNWPTLGEMGVSFLNAFDIPVTENNVNFVVTTLSSAVPALYDGMQELLKDLRVSYKLGLLSNTTNFESLSIIKKLGLEDIFDAMVFSWQINSLKPAKKNFDAITEKLEVTSEESVFIDDSEKNTTTARSFGFKTIQYKNIEQLKNDLVKMGISL